MKLPISDARKQLPALVRQVQLDSEMRVEITVHGQVVAELRAVHAESEPGAAAKTLMTIKQNMPKHRGRKTHVSSHVKEHLYGARGTSH